MLALPSRILGAEFTAFMFSSVPIWHLKAHSFPSSFRGLGYLKRSLKISDVPVPGSYPIRTDWLSLPASAGIGKVLLR